MNIFSLRMQRAALRQILRDQSKEMTQQKIDEILDQIVLLTELIELLEKK